MLLNAQNVFIVVTFAVQTITPELSTYPRLNTVSILIAYALISVADTQVTDASGKPGSGSATTRSPRDWLWAVPEDLDVAISERDFARSTDLIVKARGEIDRILVSYDVNNSRQSENPSNDSIRAPRGGKVEADTSTGFSVDGKPRAAWETLSKRIANNQKSLAEALENELITAAERHGK